MSDRIKHPLTMSMFANRQDYEAAVAAQKAMTPADELMALAGKWEKGIGADHRRICANQLRALLDSDAFRAMAMDAAIGRAYGRWYGAAQGYTDVIADAAHAAIVRDAAASGEGEVSP